jgi:aminoglycoside phosphotransferase (APT) family kinase protein
VKKEEGAMDDDAPMPVRFERFLAAVEPDRTATVTGFKPISGGYSRVTALVEVRWGDGEDEKLILRMDPPPGKEGAFSSDRDREWRLLQALWADGTVRIPRPRWFDTGEYLGCKAIVMNHVEGTPLQLTLQPGADVRSATDVYLEVAARLQQIPLDELPKEIELPPDWEAAIDNAIDIYSRAERRLSESSPVIRYVTAWLRANKPPAIPLGLVHGDFQPGNILVAEGSEPVVIDWEFTRIADPREDIGYYSGSPLPNSLYTADPAYFLSRYRDVTGLSEEQVNPEVMEYFFILGMADLLVQMMDGADALAAGEPKRVMNTFLMNSVSYFHRKYLDICRP